MKKISPEFYKWAYYVLVIWVIIRGGIDLLKWFMN
jgi:hypothetical protein